ncbi:MAG: hypothetical protein K0R15_1618 [Clostridiales bacterium]|jgi:exonuclease III|nr:hypothetical protein [Clostridiales bacterium]
MKILAWNINQRSSSRIEDIPPFVAEQILLEDPEIFVISEFCKTTESCLKISHFYKILSEKYIIHMNSEKNTDDNKIMIGVNKTIVDKDFERVIRVDDEFDNSSFNNGCYPNYLHVNVSLGNKVLSIIGVRIRVGKGDVNDYLFRKIQIQNLLSHLQDRKLESVILLGDFNNGRIKGDITKTYSEARELYHFNDKRQKSVLFDTYNYHILKDDFTNSNYEISTPTQDNQFSYFDKFTGFGYKLDHIFSKGLTVSEPTYSWDYIHCIHDCDCDKATYHINYCPTPPYPDHAILIADIITTTYICTKCGKNITELGGYSIPTFCQDCDD